MSLPRLFHILELSFIKMSSYPIQHRLHISESFYENGRLLENVKIIVLEIYGQHNRPSKSHTK